jgi:hypothetical protein
LLEDRYFCRRQLMDRERELSQKKRELKALNDFVQAKLVDGGR